MSVDFEFAVERLRALREGDDLSRWGAGDAVVVGPRAARYRVSHLMLPDGRVASPRKRANDELVEALPAMLLLNAGSLRGAHRQSA